jgi:ubiquinone/menaquinone biosynthesis C-methylase UbiE
VKSLVALALLCVSAWAAPPLDGQGRGMLQPIREEALHRDELIRRLKLQPDAVIADVGAGPGFFTLPFAQAVPRGRVIALDFRNDYLEVVRERASAAKLSNIETRVVEPAHPGLATASIDLAFLCQVDHYLPDRAAYFVDLVRALKPDGRLVVVNFDKYRDSDLAAARAAGLRVVEEWRPNPPFFVVVFRR